MTVDPSSFEFSQYHFWIRPYVEDRSILEIGFTSVIKDFGGNLIGLELPDANRHFREGESFGMVDTRFLVAKLHCPVAGTIQHNFLDTVPMINILTQINKDVFSQPILRIRPDSQDRTVMSMDDYYQIVSQNLDEVNF